MRAIGDSLPWLTSRNRDLLLSRTETRKMALTEALLVIFFCHLQVQNGIYAEDRLSCWTVNVSAEHTSYLYYYRRDPGQFVDQILGHSTPPTIPRTGFNASVYVLGAVASDGSQPISLFVHDKVGGGLHRFATDFKSMDLLFGGTSTSVEDIAVEWISKNIYYTDPKVGIGIVSYTKHFTIIIRKVAALHGIDVDPLSQLIFYADGDAGHIYQATLTGKNHAEISGSRTSHPTALVVDAVSKILYWLDEGTQYLQSWNYATSEFRQLWNSYKVGVGVFTGIDLYEPYLFISLKNEQRMKVIATNGTEVLSFSPSNGTGTRSYGISISTPQRKPLVKSACDDNNGGCDHICIHVSNIARKCLCQFGYVLDGDKCKAGRVLDDFLIFTDSSSCIIYQVDVTQDKFHMLYKSPSSHNCPGHVVYDPEEKAVFWTATNSHQIWRMDLGGRRPDVFVDLGESSSIHRLAVDAEGRHVYYTDTKLKRVARISLKDKQHTVIVQLSAVERPTELQLDVGKRDVFWIDNSDNPKIERANMDHGSDRRVLVADNIRNPSGLALDIHAHYLFWADEERKTIERLKSDGSQRQLFVVTPERCTGLISARDFLYFSGRRQLWKMNKVEKKIDSLGPQYFLVESGLSFYTSSYGHEPLPTWQIIAYSTIGFVILIAIITVAALITVYLRNKKKRNDGDQAADDTVSEDYMELDLRQNTQKPRDRNKPAVPKRPPVPPRRRNNEQTESRQEYLTMDQVRVN